MQELNQGEEYEELESLEDEEDGTPSYEDEGSEDTESGLDKIFGIPKKPFIIGAAVLSIVLLGLILLVAKKFSGGSEDTGDVGEIAGDEIISPEVYDESGNLIGTTDGMLDGCAVYDESGSVIGIIDSVNGTTILYDAMGNEVSRYTQGGLGSSSDVGSEDEGLYQDDILQDNSSVPDDVEFSDENEALRKAGYTGDEIELILSTGMDVQEMINSAKEAQDEALKKRLKKVANKKSKEFLTIYNNSLFCMDKVTFDKFDPDAAQSMNYEGSYVVNSDYEKCPTYGYQLMIKCKIANGTYAFYNVTPDRWSTLPEEGNIVLQIYYTMYGTNNVNMYITNIEEIDTTKITVNPSDSAMSLEDILSDEGNGAPIDNFDVPDDEGSYSEEDDGLNEPW